MAAGRAARFRTLAPTHPGTIRAKVLIAHSLSHFPCDVLFHINILRAVFLHNRCICAGGSCNLCIGAHVLPRGVATRAQLPSARLIHSPALSMQPRPFSLGDAPVFPRSACLNWGKKTKLCQVYSLITRYKWVYFFITARLRQQNVHGEWAKVGPRGGGPASLTRPAPLLPAGGSAPAPVRRGLFPARRGQNEAKRPNFVRYMAL